MKVFVSYSRRLEGEWVFERLLPCLRGAGVDVLIDEEQFTLGQRVVGEMDKTQDQAEATLLVLTPEYLKSPYCQHEMQRALAAANAGRAKVLPVMRVESTVPDEIQERLYADLVDDGQAKPWRKLLDDCGGNLKVSAPAWLAALRELQQCLERNESVNLVAPKDGGGWALIREVQRAYPDLAEVDLESGVTAYRAGLVAQILAASGSPMEVPDEPRDLAILQQILEQRSLTRLAFLYFDLVAHRDYGLDFFGTLRNLMTVARKLVLVVHSRRPFSSFLPAGHPLSAMGMTQVELKGIP